MEMKWNEHIHHSPQIRILLSMSHVTAEQTPMGYQATTPEWSASTKVRFCSFRNISAHQNQERRFGSNLGDPPIFFVHFFRCFCKLVVGFMDKPVISLKPGRRMANSPDLLETIELLLQRRLRSNLCWLNSASFQKSLKKSWLTNQDTHTLGPKIRSWWQWSFFFSSVFIFFVFRNGRVVKETRSPFEKWTLVAFPRWQWGLGFWRSTIGSCRGGRGNSRSHWGDRKVGPPTIVVNGDIHNPYKWPKINGFQWGYN